jgi:hypothetical protein
MPVGLSGVKAQADRFDIGADLSQRLGMLIDGTPFDEFTGRPMRRRRCATPAQRIGQTES